MNIPRTLLRLLGGFALASGSVAAGATVTVPDNGDIFLGVRASGGQGSGVSLLVNIGDDTTFRNATGGSTLSLANVGTELSAAFGANWSTRSDLSWAFFGARNQTNPVTYSTRAQSPVGLPAPSFPAQDLSQRTATKNQIISVVDAYGLLDAFNGNANAALQTNALNSGSYSFQVGSTGTSDFGSLSQWVSIEGDFGAGASGTVLDFFRYAVSSTGELNQVSGYIRVRELFVQNLLEFPAQPWQSLIRPALHISDSASLTQLLALFLDKHEVAALVDAPDGNIVGWITLDDVMKVLMGARI